MGCTQSTLSPQGATETSKAPAAAAEACSLNLPLDDLSSPKPGIKSVLNSPRTSIRDGFSKLKSKISSLRASITPSTSPGVSPRKGATAPVESAERIGNINNSKGIDEAGQVPCIDVEEAKCQAVSHSLPLYTRANAEGAGLPAAPEAEAAALEEPTVTQLRAVWVLMKIRSSSDPMAKMRWLHELEWQLVSLDPMEHRQPTRRMLVEAEAVETCLSNLTQNPDDLPLCISCLAILVHLSLAKEATAKIAALGGIETTAKLLRKYFDLCKKQIKEQEAVAEATAVAEVPEGAAAASATAEVSPEESAEEELLPADLAEHSEGETAPVELATEPPVQQAVLKRVTCGMLSRRRSKKKMVSVDEHTVTAVQVVQASKDLKLSVEFVTLVWRLVFATSLDGDEYAQLWVAAGVPDLALEAISISAAAFSECAFVCWALGALRFMPLANPQLSETYVQQRNLLPAVIARMECLRSDPLVLENGFAVLANYQRRQPLNTKFFTKQHSTAWAKCVSWLSTDESLQKVDVLFQGLFAIGLACSYCQEAVRVVKEAGGLQLMERVLQLYGDMPREASQSSAAESKIATLQQFAEALKLLLTKLSPEEKEAAAAAAKQAKEEQNMVTAAADLSGVEVTAGVTKPSPAEYNLEGTSKETNVAQAAAPEKAGETAAEGEEPPTSAELVSAAGAVPMAAKQVETVVEHVPENHAVAVTEAEVPAIADTATPDGHQEEGNTPDGDKEGSRTAGAANEEKNSQAPSAAKESTPEQTESHRIEREGLCTGEEESAARGESSVSPGSDEDAEGRKRADRPQGEEGTRADKRQPMKKPRKTG